MTNYSSPQAQIIADLIEAANPGFEAKLPLGSYVLGTPTAITPVLLNGVMVNTSIRISSGNLPNSVGSVLLQYRRIDVGLLFKGMTLKFNTYSSVAGKWLQASYLPVINAATGLTLTSNDLSYPYLGTGTSPMVMLATSLCYIGTLNVTWATGLVPLSTTFAGALNQFAGRLWGPTALTLSLPLGESLVYGYDVSNQPAGAGIKTLATPYSSPAGDTNATVAGLISYLNSTTKRKGYSNAAITTQGGLCGTTWTRYALPNAAVPEADLTRFSYCTVITGGAGAWFSGRILLQYN